MKYLLLLAAFGFTIAAGITTNVSAAPGDLYATCICESVIPEVRDVTRISSDGNQSTFASGFLFVGHIAFDKSGNLFVANSGAGEIVKITPDGTRSTFASQLSGPTGLAFDRIGNLFFTQSGEITKIASDGIRTTFASGLTEPTSLAFNTAGDLFVIESGNAEILKLAPDGTKNTFASSLANPLDLAFDNAGNLYVSEFSIGVISKFTPAGTKSTFVSGREPGGLVFDNAGNLSVSERFSITKFSSTGEPISFTAPGMYGWLAFEPIVEKLRNISARGFVGSGDNVLIGGFILGGNGLATNGVLVRAIGPSLSQEKVTNPLSDPILELYNSSGTLIARNDNWQDTQSTQIAATGLAPNDPREAVIFATLPAGNFTAIVRGAGGSTGTALVEVYSR